MSTTTKTSPSPRIRFNHGFWDGHTDANTRPHRTGPFPNWGKEYSAGYDAGWKLGKEGWLGESSDEAWKNYLNQKGAKS